MDFLNSRSKAIIALCGVVLCAIGTAPLIFLALMEDLPIFMSAFFTPVGAWFLEIRNTINMLTAHFEEKEKANVLKRLEANHSNTRTKINDQQSVPIDKTDVLTSEIVKGLHQLLIRLNDTLVR